MLHSIFASTLGLMGKEELKGRQVIKIANKSNRVITVGFVYSLKIRRLF